MKTIEEKNLMCYFFLYEEKNNLLRKKINVPTSELNFHEDWNKLINVCRKFDNLNIDSEEYVEICDEVDHLVTCYEIKNVFEGIVVGISWYYENNRNN